MRKTANSVLLLALLLFIVLSTATISAFAANVTSYFDCDVQINTTSGETVNLYNSPGDTSRADYFDRGQTAYSTYGAKLSDGSTWYCIQAMQGNRVVDFWLNSNSSGVTIVKKTVEPEIHFSSSSFNVSVGDSVTQHITFKGDAVEKVDSKIWDSSACSGSLGPIDLYKGTIDLTLTAEKSGGTLVEVFLLDSDGNKIKSSLFSVMINAKTYTVSYSANGGSGAPSSQTKTEDTSLTLSTTKPTRSGYTFLGWSTSSSSATVEYQPGDSFTKNENVTLYAVWKKMTSETDVADMLSTEPEIQFSSSDFKISVGDTATQYITFKGDAVEEVSGKIWNPSVCSGSWGPIDLEKGTINLTLTAKKSGGTLVEVFLLDRSGDKIKSSLFSVMVNAKTYTVSYSANGGSGAPSSQTKAEDTALTLSTTRPTRSGYTFLGWSTSSSSATVEYQPGDSFTKNENVTLYAVWKKMTSETDVADVLSTEPEIQFSSSDFRVSVGDTVTQHITFKGDAVEEISGRILDSSVCSGNWGPIDLEEGTINLTLTAKKSGGTLVEVFLLDSDGDKIKSSLFSVMVNAKTYTVSYNANGGSGAPSSQTKAEDTVLTLSTTKPTRSGYTFLGWSTSSSSATAEYQPGDSFATNQNITLYAVWKKASTLKISPTSYPKETLTVGSYYSLRGTVTSNCKITSIKGEILTSSGKSTGNSKTVYPNATSYSFFNSAIDTAMKFNKLSAGTYYLKYTAIDSSGKTATWQSPNFKIKTIPTPVSSSAAVEKATSQMEAWAADDRIGYKWGGWGPEYDCSHAVIMAWEKAGVKVKSAGAAWTGNMYDIFKKCGFIDVTSSVKLESGAGLQRGDVLLIHHSQGDKSQHTVMYCGNGRMVQASWDYDGVKGDSSREEFWVSNYRLYYNEWTGKWYNWDYVLRYVGD